jgi:acyl carrier protein
MTNSATLEHDLRGYIGSELLGGKDLSQLQSQDDLLEILDSLRILRLARHLEDAYSIEIGDDDLSVDNLGSLERVVAFVNRKRGS